MKNTKHILTVSSVWISIVYVICFAGVALLPDIRSGFMKYALHTEIDMGQNIVSVETFLSGLVIWNVITLVAVWLFVLLDDRIKE